MRRTRDNRRALAKAGRTLDVDPELTLLELEVLYMSSVKGHLDHWNWFTGPEQNALNRATRKLRVILDDTGRFDTFRDRLFPPSERVIHVPESLRARFEFATDTHRD